MTVLLAACGGDDGGDDEGGSGVEPGATHAEALQALTVGTCAVASCHGNSARGDLQLTGATNLVELLVQPACEAPGLKLVEPGDPNKSWLWIKLTGKYAAGGKLESQSSWGTAGNCAKEPGVGFGNRMPDVSPPEWTQANLDIIESWIKGGAPGPN